MKDVIVGHVMGFSSKTDDEQYHEHDVLLEVTDVTEEGCVEIAFDDPERGDKVRHYLKLDFADLTRKVTQFGRKSS